MMAAANDQVPLLEVEGLRREFGRGSTRYVAVQEVSFRLDAGQTLAVVGESGAGKSTLARMLAGLQVPTAGSIHVEGRELRLRPGSVSPIQMVFQDPRDALSRHLSVATSVGEALRRRPRRERAERVAELLARVGIDAKRASERPRGFSGGQLQRIVLARALAADPRVLLCDEPTSALDVSVQAQIVNLLLDLQAESGFACVLVTHDLGIARTMADELMVLRNGVVEEHGPAAEFFAGPRSAYGRDLLAASDDRRRPVTESIGVAEHG